MLAAGSFVHQPTTGGAMATLPLQDLRASPEASIDDVLAQHELEVATVLGPVDDDVLATMLERDGVVDELGALLDDGYGVVAILTRGDVGGTVVHLAVVNPKSERR